MIEYYSRSILRVGPDDGRRPSFRSVSDAGRISYYRCIAGYDVYRSVLEHSHDYTYRRFRNVITSIKNVHRRYLVFGCKTKWANSYPQYSRCYVNVVTERLNISYTRLSTYALSIYDISDASEWPRNFDFNALHANTIRRK